MAFGCYGAAAPSVIIALTTQDTKGTQGVQGPAASDFVKRRVCDSAVSRIDTDMYMDDQSS